MTNLKDYKTTYNFSEITDIFKPSKPITVIDLQIDINNLKQELKELKLENDAGDARKLLFNIIYVCKSIVFLCFRP